MSNTMETLTRLADIAVEIDELKSGLDSETQLALGLLATALHDVVENASGDQASEIYGQEESRGHAHD